MFTVTTVYPLYGMRNAEGLGRILHPPSAANGWPTERFQYGAWETGVDLLFPSYEEWQYLQPSETQNQDDWFDLDFHLTVPPCLVVTMDYDEGPGVDRPGKDDLPLIEKDVHRNGLAALRSLRLLRSGWFCDPELTEHVTMHSWDNQLVRHLGPYRYAFHDEDAFDRVQPPEPAFELSRRDFEFGPRGESPLRTLQRPLLQLSERPIDALDIALQAFTRCAGIGLDWTQRFLVLGTGLNVVFGDHPGRSRALAHAVLGEEDTAWLFDDFRRIRNAAAHGRVPEVDAPEVAYERATSLLRTALLDQTRFAEAWCRTERPASARRFLDDYRAHHRVA